MSKSSGAGRSPCSAIAPPPPSPRILVPWFPCLCPNRASLHLRVQWRLSSSRRSRNSSPCLRSSVQPLQLREAGIWCQRTGLASGSPVSLPESQSNRPLGLVSAGIKVFPGIRQSPPGLGRGRFCPCPTLLPPLTSARSPSTLSIANPTVEPQPSSCGLCFSDALGNWQVSARY